MSRGPFGEEVIFMQKVAPAHYAKMVRDFLVKKFEKEWKDIGRRGVWEWSLGGEIWQ